MSGGRYGRGKAPERACIKLELWPEPDRLLWLAAIAPGDIFEDAGSRAGHRPISNRNVARGYGRYLTYLTLNGLLRDDDRPADRITRELVPGYVAELDRLGNKKNTIMVRLEELGEMAKVFGPDRDWSFIGALAARVRARKDDSTGKQGKLVEAHELFDLGLALIEKSYSAPNARQAAILFRDGLIIALLALRPMRRKNLAELTIGHDLVRGPGGWQILLAPEQTKTHRAIPYPWPVELLEPLEIYLSVHRKTLIEREGRWKSEVGDRLWVSNDGSPLTQMGMYDTIVRRTRGAVDRSVNPHLFRDIAATTLAINDPKSVLAAAALLGNSPTTMQRYYNQAKSLDAQRSYVGSIRKLRRKTSVGPLTSRLGARGV